jgi:hypothetical protein
MFLPAGGIVDIQNISCSVTYTCDPLDIPNDLTASAVSTSQIDLNWSAVEGADLYKIYNCEGTSPIGQSNSTNYSVSGLDDGKVYNYRIKAFSNCTSSDFSECASTRTDLLIDFGVNDNTLIPGSTAYFTTNSSETFDVFNWSFSGGTPTTSDKETPSITYNSPGTFDVTLTATSTELNVTESKTISNLINVNSIYDCGSLGFEISSEGDQNMCF